MTWPIAPSPTNPTSTKSPAASERVADGSATPADHRAGSRRTHTSLSRPGRAARSCAAREKARALLPFHGECVPARPWRHPDVDVHALRVLFVDLRIRDLP